MHAIGGHDVSIETRTDTRASLSPYARERAECDGRKFSGDVQTPEMPVTPRRCEPDFERSIFVFTDGRPRERAISSPRMSRGFVATQITVKSYSRTRVGALRSRALNLAKRASEHKIRRLNRKSETRLDSHSNKYDFELIKNIWMKSQ